MSLNTLRHSGIMIAIRTWRDIDKSKELITGNDSRVQSRKQNITSSI